MNRWGWAAAAVIFIGLGFYLAKTHAEWSSACWFVAGMCWEYFLQGVHWRRIK
jgi:hypothetical protein